MIDPIRTGKMIARLRQSAGWTQAQLADRVSVTHQAVSKWENGTALPDVQTLLSMSALFGVSMEALLTAQEDAAVEMATPPTEPLDAAPDTEAREAENTGTTAEKQTEVSSSTTGKTVEWERVIALAPYLPAETLAELVSRELGIEGAAQGKRSESEESGKRTDWRRIVGIAPQLPRETLLAFAKETRGAVDWSAICRVAMYLPKDAFVCVMERAENAPDRAALVALAPYLPKDAYAPLIRRFGGALDWDTVAALRMYLSKESFGLLLAYVDAVPSQDAVHELAMYMPKDMLAELAARLVHAAPGDENAEKRDDEGVHIDLGSFGETGLGKRISEAVRNALSGLKKAGFGVGADIRIDLDDDANPRPDEDADIEALIDEERWDELLARYDGLTEEQRGRLVEALIDEERWDELIARYDVLTEEQRGRLVEALIDEEEWDRLKEIFASLSDEQKGRLIQGLVEDGRWKDLRALL